MQNQSKTKARKDSNSQILEKNDTKLCIDLEKEGFAKLKDLANAENIPIESMATLLLELAIAWRHYQETA